MRVGPDMNGHDVSNIIVAHATLGRLPSARVWSAGPYTRPLFISNYAVLISEPSTFQLHLSRFGQCVQFVTSHGLSIF
jgi:hypothetical protein